MQLGRTAIVCAAALLGGAIARAENRADIKINYFVEPAKTQRLHIVVPQLAVNVDLHPVVSINIGYDVDIVSGATPRVYGTQVDAVSSATQFSDQRHAPHGGMQLRVGPTTLDVGYTFATEHDYRSHSLDAAAKVDLWGKNTTIALGYAHNWDRVCDVDNRGAQPLERRSLGASDGCFTDAPGLRLEPVTINSYSATLTQIFHPLVVGDLTTSFEVIEGFQTNPYRRVRLFGGTVEAQEAHPLLRQRVAVQARLRIAVPKAKAAVQMLGRFYWDTWGIKAGTAELAWEQYIVPQLLFRLRARFYQQGRAVFYRDAGEMLSYESVGPVGQYFTGDREMSPFRDYLVGLRLSYLKAANERGKVGKVFQSIDVHVKAELMGYESLTPLPPNLPRSDGFIDALILQLGVAMMW